MHFGQTLSTALIQSVRLRNIFKNQEVARHFLSSHHIPQEVLSEVSAEVIDEIQCYSGKKDSFKVLEVGIGTGRFTAPLALKLNEKFPGSKVYGLDNSKAMLNEAKTNIPDLDLIEFRLYDITLPLPYPRDFFDASISFYVYHCIHNWRKALNNVINVVASPKLLIFLREYSQWGFHLDCRFDDIEITDMIYKYFWEEYFKNRQEVSPLPKVEISASNIDTLKDYLQEIGFEHINKILQTKWTRITSYEEALKSIELGLFTKLRVGLNKKNRNLLKNKMLNWLIDNNITPDASTIQLPAAIECDIFYRRTEH